MPEPTKAAIAVPSEDPKKKKPEEKAEDVKDGASKKKDEEKEGEELVRSCEVIAYVDASLTPGCCSQKKTCS